jgi:hypothetical protein
MTTCYPDTMSRDVYIAHPGFKDTPIPAADFAHAVHQCPALRLREIVPANGKPVFSASLAGDERARIRLSHYGLGEARHPSRELVEAMFEVAAILGAGVYSERLAPYASPEDWERRTAAYRRAENERVAALARRRRRHAALLLLAVAAGMAIAWLMPGLFRKLG